GDLRVDDVRTHFADLGATVRLTAWWNGAALALLIDERHALVVDGGVRALARLGWRQTETEVTFNEWGERGSIDLFSARPDIPAVFVGETKSEWGSVEETVRVLDVRARLAPTICEKRFGFRPTTVGVALLFSENRTARRVAQLFAATLAAAYPSRNRQVRHWLRRPSGPMRGLWSLTDVDTDRPGRR
ncbi:MAG: hypothetical protein ACXWXJ_09790, partial [Aeromicrobium sp.]